MKLATLMSCELQAYLDMTMMHNKNNGSLHDLLGWCKDSKKRKCIKSWTCSRQEDCLPVMVLSLHQFTFITTVRHSYSNKTLQILMITDLKHCESKLMG